MFPEIERLGKWLRWRSPQAATHIYYDSDVRLFFTWTSSPAYGVTLCDVDAYVAYCQCPGHAAATINRWLAALCCFYRFLAVEPDGVMLALLNSQSLANPCAR